MDLIQSQFKLVVLSKYKVYAKKILNIWLMKIFYRKQLFRIDILMDLWEMFIFVMNALGFSLGVIIWEFI